MKSWRQYFVVLALLPFQLGSFVFPTQNNHVSRICLSFFFANTADQSGSSSASDSHHDGRIVRLATRSFHPRDSKPSSRNYSTRKIAQDVVTVEAGGVMGDYNHYRSVALSNTNDRAVSILTTDCLEYLKLYKYPVRDGDLGENVLVDGVDFRYFEIGKTYQLGSSEDSVLLEITEPMIPCANLCKLPYINDESKKPTERVAACQDFLKLLDVKPGMRGWYAKVLKSGRLSAGDSVFLV